MTILEYAKEYGAESGLGVALIDNDTIFEDGTSRIVTPYFGSWMNESDAPEICSLEVDESRAASVNGRYYLVRHSGLYEELYNEQEKNHEQGQAT